MVVLGIVGVLILDIVVWCDGKICKFCLFVGRLDI